MYKPSKIKIYAYPPYRHGGILSDGNGRMFSPVFVRTQDCWRRSKRHFNRWHKQQWKYEWVEMNVATAKGLRPWQAYKIPEWRKTQNALA